VEVLAVRIAFEHGARLDGDAGAELHLPQFVAPGGKRLVEDVRLQYRHAVVDPIARLDQSGGLLGGNLASLSRAPRCCHHKHPAVRARKGP
jgi:hypothetical protein